MNRGIICRLLESVYSYLKLNGDFAETKQRIIRIRLSLKTGLSMNKYTHDSEDQPEDIHKIINVLHSPEFGLDGFKFEEFTPGA